MGTKGGSTVPLSCPKSARFVALRKTQLPTDLADGSKLSLLGVEVGPETVIPGTGSFATSLS